MADKNQLAGAIELERWLQDLLRQGLATAIMRDTTFWEEFAARMVNAKLGGIARRIRTFKNWLSTDDAHQRLLMEIGELYLFAKGLQKYETLPTDLQQEILTTAGNTIKKEKVLQQETVEDQWIIIGQTEGKEEDVRFRRTWLQGISSHQTALLLDFAWRFTPFEVNWLVGSSLQATIAYYPGAFLQRALVKDFAIVYQAFELFGYADWEVMLRQYADALSKNPWLLYFPALIDTVTPVLQNNELTLIDTKHSYLPIKVSETTKWKLIGISGEKPLQLFGEWDGQYFYPLTATALGRIISF